MLKAVWSYTVIFMLIAFVVTCCMILFINTMASTMNIELTENNIESAAKITMLNVLLLTFLITLCDYIRRKIMIDRPVKKIQDGLKKLMEGDFSARISVQGNAHKFGEISDSINLLASELSGVETLRTDFIANVSHELKTPLAVIQNYAAMLRSPDLDEQTRLEYARSITDTTRRLSSLITNILKLNRLENQQIFPEKKEYYLGEQLCECLLNFEGEWEKKSLEIETDIDEEIKVTADSELLSVVWSNLFSNAVKFTESGGKIGVSLRRENGFAVVSVSDTGCGISPETGKHIFEKFYQGDTSHAAQGNGLGLALVKRIIDITGGEISAQSTLGKGSTFTVKLKENTDEKTSP